MKSKQPFFLAICITIIFSSLFPSNSFATSWVHNFVVWDDYIYVMVDEYVTDVEKKIGSVTKYSDMDSLTGNFSNIYKKGTKYYSIKGISTNEAIAVEEEGGIYRKAIREGEYEPNKSKFLGLRWSSILGSLFILFILFLPIYHMEKKMKR